MKSRCAFPLPVHLRNRLKAATRRAVQDAGGLDEAAVITGLSTTQLSRMQRAEHADLPTLAVVMALTEHCGTRAFADCLADLAGAETTPANMLAAGAEVISECAEAAHRLGRALADGTVTPREMAGLAGVFDDLRAAMAQLQGCGAPTPGGKR